MISTQIKQNVISHTWTSYKYLINIITTRTRGQNVSPVHSEIAQNRGLSKRDKLSKMLSAC